MNDFNSEPANQGDDVLTVPPGDVREVGAAHPKRGLPTKKLNAYIDDRLGEHATTAALLIRDVVKRTRLWRKEKFDVRDFHHSVLSRGAVPLSLLDSIVDHDIERL